MDNKIVFIIAIGVIFILIGASLWGKYDPMAPSAYEAGQTLTIMGINILATMAIIGLLFYT